MDARKEDYLASVLQRLQREYDEMAPTLGAPAPRRVFTKQAEGFWFRYPSQSDTLLCFLKGVKLVSTLNAALLLLRAGYVQECGALFRIAADCYSDILFCLVPRDGDKLSRDQERFFEEFFQEEFDDPAYPLGSNQKRDNVPRKTVFASFGNLVRDQLNPSDAQSTLLTLHKAFSGYVHGAYPHIMELYGGDPPRFHMSGMTNTPRQVETLTQFLTELYRAIMASELVARKVGLEGSRLAMRALLVEYETRLGLKPTQSPEALVRNAKKKKKWLTGTWALPGISSFKGLGEGYVAEEEASRYDIVPKGRVWRCLVDSE
jgi:hypothetical protein